MKTALIISGGEFCQIPAEIEYEYVIACDKGAFYARMLKITPDIIMGDFDSFEGDIHKEFENIHIETFPVMKDDTDTMLAIKHAFKMGFEHIVIACALGGQMDHTIANLQSLAYIAGNGGVGEIISDREHITTLAACEQATNSITVSRRGGFSLSLFSLTDKCDGLSIKGAKYNADNITLTNTFPLGHGNSFVEDTVEISIQSGILLIVESKL